MKMSVKHLTILTVGVVLAGMLLATNLMGADVPKLSGITVKDERPNGCVDCHVKVSDEKDDRMPAELAHFEKHPPIDKVVKVVPKDCGMCHKPDAKAGALSQLTHKNHFQKPSENTFVTNHNGDCLSCHSLDMNTFKMGVKSGPANW
jgi:hypothetical protein